MPAYYEHVREHHLRVPAHLFQRLAARARAEHRSANAQAMAILEAALRPDTALAAEAK